MRRPALMPSTRPAPPTSSILTRSPCQHGNALEAELLCLSPLRGVRKWIALRKEQIWSLATFISQIARLLTIK